MFYDPPKPPYNLDDKEELKRIVAYYVMLAKGQSMTNVDMQQAITFYEFFTNAYGKGNELAKPLLIYCEAGFFLVMAQDWWGESSDIEKAKTYMEADYRIYINQGVLGLVRSNWEKCFEQGVFRASFPNILEQNPALINLLDQYLFHMFLSDCQLKQ
jgi:hypothetical protein